MSICHMDAKQLADFKKDRKAVLDTSFSTPDKVSIFHMGAKEKGVVVTLDDGKGGAHVIGDTINIWLGEDTPSYFT